MKRLMFLSICSGFLIVSGCVGNYFRFEEVRKVRVGMTEAEVVSIMGKPNVVNSAAGNVKWVYAYGTGLGTGGSCSFVFSNKVVVAVPQVPDSFK